MVDGVTYVNMKELLPYLFDGINIAVEDQINDEYNSFRIWSDSQQYGSADPKVYHYLVNVKNPNGDNMICIAYEVTDSSLYDAQNGDQYCNVVKVAADLGFSNDMIGLW